MIGIVGMQRTQHTNVVDVPAKSRQQFADRHTAFPARLKLEGGRKQSAGGPLGQQVGALGPLSRILRQLRFGIEQIGLERTSIHE